ncbi:jg24049 [Pararge aegeria aegeria]|uniref:Jg24049 protein n=1 Tax=Pararge aegeria aegeria TaxID=348720 RepID=A0A8S4S0P4_9NEOP|nr:jg24049 [Pararge aegeria aegeria]
MGSSVVIKRRGGVMHVCLCRSEQVTKERERGRRRGGGRAAPQRRGRAARLLLLQVIRADYIATGRGSARGLR